MSIINTETGKKMSGMLKNIDSFPGQFGQGDISDAPRCLGNGHNSRPTSPLKFFARAKSKSNDMFKGIADYVLEAEKFLKGISYIYHYSI
jgi:hypothetical protein